jgi:hypothetical protein
MKRNTTTEGDENNEIRDNKDYNKYEYKFNDENTDYYNNYYKDIENYNDVSYSKIFDNDSAINDIEKNDNEKNENENEN